MEIFNLSYLYILLLRMHTIYCIKTLGSRF
uniref:Uncharacterized protein n=1 Tax=Anguilla anguilla TaxID=7936 RepID=A0A0E9S292_ANGAN